MQEDERVDLRIACRDESRRDWRSDALRVPVTYFSIVYEFSGWWPTEWKSRWSAPSTLTRSTRTWGKCRKRRYTINLECEWQTTSSRLLYSIEKKFAVTRRKLVAWKDEQLIARNMEALPCFHWYFLHFLSCVMFGRAMLTFWYFRQPHQIYVAWYACGFLILSRIRKGRKQWRT